jgi:hypothetical protein
MIFLAACSSRTKYQVYKKRDGGYEQSRFDKNLSVVNFRGNNYTMKSTAELFAKFRAVELCHEAQKKVADLVGIVDHSENKTITRTSGGVYGFPSYYYGYSPFYNRYSGFGFGTSIGIMSGSSWNETLTYPNVDVVYRCGEKVYEPEIILREVSADDMKTLTKDLKGALQVEKFIDGSPNKKLEQGDFILKVSGERIEKSWQLMAAFDQDHRRVPVEVMRDGNRMKMEIESKDVTDKVEKSEQEIIDKGCDFKEIKKRPICKK